MSETATPGQHTFDARAEAHGIIKSSRHAWGCGGGEHSLFCDRTTAALRRAHDAGAAGAREWTGDEPVAWRPLAATFKAERDTARAEITRLSGEVAALKAWRARWKARAARFARWARNHRFNFNQGTREIQTWFAKYNAARAHAVSLRDELGKARQHLGLAVLRIEARISTDADAPETVRQHDNEGLDSCARDARAFLATTPAPPWGPKEACEELAVAGCNEGCPCCKHAQVLARRAVPTSGAGEPHV